MKKKYIFGGVVVLLLVLVVVFVVSSNNRTSTQQIARDATGVNLNSNLTSNEKVNEAGRPTGYDVMEAQAETMKAQVALQTGNTHVNATVGDTLEPRPLQPAPVLEAGSNGKMPQGYNGPNNNQQQEAKEQERFMLQFQDVLTRVGVGTPQLLGVAYPSPEKADKEIVARNAEQGDQEARKASNTPKSILIHGGTLEAIAIDTAADSKTGGELAATLMSGPYRGKRIIGEIRKDAEGGRVVFTKMFLPTGEVKIKAVAMTSDATSGDISDDVDNKYFERYIVRPFGAAASALASAIPTKRASVMTTGPGYSSTSMGGLGGADVGAIVAAKAAESLARESMTADVRPVHYIKPASLTGEIRSVMFTEDVVL